jgi:peptidoglycan/LPS O-acetylase OafA/YrhL
MTDVASSQSAQRSASRRNCFDALRLLAALAVLVSHSFALAGRHQPSIGETTIGTAAVIVFFSISGFLITQSWRYEPHLWRYLAKRVLRIMPALIVVLALVTFLLGPLVSTRPLGSYMQSSQTWTFFVRNAVFRSAGELPGVFVHNPYPRAIDGSLWTLPIEVHAYLLVAVLGVVGLLRMRASAAGAFLAVCLASAAMPQTVGNVLGDDELVRTFALGALFYLYRDRVPWRAWIAAVLLLAWVLARDSGAALSLAVLAIAYTTIYLAHRLPMLLRSLTRHGDFSYGIYVWAFPMQQTAALVWKGISPVELIAVSLPVTCLLAFLSWRLVEQPALRLKARVAGVSAAARATAATADTAGREPGGAVAVEVAGAEPGGVVTEPASRIFTA